MEQYADKIPERSGWAAQYWSQIEGAEALATREHVALYNLSAFVKAEVSGSGACDFLQRLSANNIDKPQGKIVYTAMLDEKGGIRADLTITRLAPDRFLVLTGAGVGMRDLNWLRQNAPTDGSVFVDDVTSRYGAIGLWGPKSRDVLSQLTTADVSDEAFPYFQARQLMLGDGSRVGITPKLRG